jgi:putative membrane protein
MRGMMKFAIRIVINAVAIWVATLVVGGITIQHDDTRSMVLTLLVVALIFGVVNAVIRPVIKILSLPLLILTLGLFTFVINALMLLLTSWLSHKFHLDFSVSGFFSALLGALVISVVSFLISLAVPD